ncbi:acyl-CoA dehydrogenase family protein [Gordonia sp. OPL2]|uniref:acyl-CoA dehydrogenase family protein n=1 Tax=Gordonia sp. OPL2 TaxID=2486274 RepID=UPI0021CC9A05|nr:acyl-CoA dehydrogenase family protein [Gordonia sp. OPL2]
MTATWAVDNSVHVLPDDEETDLRSAVRELLASAGDIEDVRRVADTVQGFSAEVWRQLTDSIAVTTMTAPETFGGLGFGFRYLCAVVEECGRALRPEPVLASAVLGAPALLTDAGSDVADLRRDALSGRAIVTTSPLTTASDQLTASGSSSGWTVDGTTRLIDIPSADVAIVTAEIDSGRALFAVQIGGGAQVTRLTSIDPTRPRAELRCAGASAALLTASGDHEAVIRYLRTRGIIALAAENVGIADRLFEMTCDYTKSRQQFGRTIASFQAIKHRLADMFLDVERARSAARYAAALSDSSDCADASALARLEVAASVAGAVTGDAAVRVATEAIQLHGGIGFTWEHPAHSYYRRVLTNESLLDGPFAHRQRIAALAFPDRSGVA